MTHHKLFRDSIPPEHLLERIEGQIAQIRIRRDRLHLFFLGIVTSLSFLALIPASSFLLTGLERSGSSAYLSLLFTDMDIFVLYSQTFLLSIAETLPLVEVTVFLSVLFGILWSLPRLLFATDVLLYGRRRYAVN